jgi:hypothetical protein
VWGKLHNEELSDPYSSPNTVQMQIEKNEMGGACGPYGEGRVVPCFGGET